MGFVGGRRGFDHSGVLADIPWAAFAPAADACLVRLWGLGDQLAPLSAWGVPKTSHGRDYGSGGRIQRAGRNVRGSDAKSTAGSTSGRAGRPLSDMAAWV